MTTNPNEVTVRTPRDLAELWQSLMGSEGPGLRSLWLVLLDGEGRPRPVVVPIDDVPLRPDLHMVAGLGEVLQGLRDHGEPVLLLSRPGSRGMTDADRAWARGLAPLSRWPVHLYTPAGVRVFAPDDLVEAS